MKSINSSKFTRELASAGLVGLAFSWGVDGTFWFSDVLSQDTVADIFAVYDAHDPTPIIDVPPEVTMRQARLVLMMAGLLEQVDFSINAMPEPDRSAALIEWNHSAVVQRNQPLVLSMGTALGLTSEQLDNLFIQARSL